MRYFLIHSRPESLLPGGIVEATSSTGLILFTRSFTGLGSGCLGAATVAIAMSTITARADNDLGMTTSTLIETAGCLHRQKSRWGAGFITEMCNTLRVVLLHGCSWGYGVNLDRQITAGVIPSSTTLPLFY
jgi:hypothetical protein